MMPGNDKQFIFYIQDVIHFLYHIWNENEFEAFIGKIRYGHLIREKTKMTK